MNEDTRMALYKFDHYKSKSKPKLKKNPPNFMIKMTIADIQSAIAFTAMRSSSSKTITRQMTFVYLSYSAIWRLMNE